MSLGLLLSGLLGEGAARLSSPPPRTNVMQSSEGMTLLTDEAGETYWRHTAPERRNEGCTDRPLVALFGSSITYGSSVEAAEAFSAGIQRRRPGWCVRNYGEPGFGYEAKRVVAREVLPALRPDVVLWEIWINDNASYLLANGMAVDPADLQRDEAGYPTWLPLPGWLHHWLFQHSRLYAYGTLARAPGGHLQGRDIWTRYERGELDALKAAVEASGAALVLSIWPWLDRPFQSSAAQPPAPYEPVRRWATETNTPLVDVAALLVDEDYLALRIDPCCHYSPAGHEVLAERLTPILTRVLAPPPNDPAPIDPAPIDPMSTDPTP